MAAIALIAVGFGVQRNLNKPVHTASIMFPTASGLVPGSDVFEAGSKVGTISDITPVENQSCPAPENGAQPDGTCAVVKVSVGDEYWPLHQGVTAGIRPKSLLGEKYVDLHDGAAKAPAFDATQLIMASSSSTPVELDQFLNSLDQPTRTAAKVLLDDLGAGIAGRGSDLNAAIQAGREDLAHLAVTGQTLDNRDADLDRILLGLDGVLSKLTTDDQLSQMSQLITNAQQVLNATEAESASLSRSFVDASNALTDLNGAIDPAAGSLRDLLTVAPHLLSVLGQEATLLAKDGANITGHQPTGYNLLDLLNIGNARGPYTSGGALEHNPNGYFAIFRVCLNNPFQNSCTGHSVNPPAPQAAADYNGGAGEMADLAGFLGT